MYETIEQYLTEAGTLRSRRCAADTTVFVSGQRQVERFMDEHPIVMKKATWKVRFSMHHFAWTPVFSCLMLFILGGAAFAAQSSVPGDMLYPVKRSLEAAVLTVAPSPEIKAKLHLQYADRRMEELAAVAPSQLDAQGIQEIMDNYTSHVEAAEQEVETMTSPEVREEFSGLITRSWADGEVTLQNLQNNNGEVVAQAADDATWAVSGLEDEWSEAQGSVSPAPEISELASAASQPLGQTDALGEPAREKQEDTAVLSEGISEVASGEEAIAGENVVSVSPKREETQDSQVSVNEEQGNEEGKSNSDSNSISNNNTAPSGQGGDSIVIQSETEVHAESASKEGGAQASVQERNSTVVVVESNAPITDTKGEITESSDVSINSSTHEDTTKISFADTLSLSTTTPQILATDTPPVIATSTVPKAFLPKPVSIPAIEIPVMPGQEDGVQGNVHSQSSSPAAILGQHGYEIIIDDIVNRR